MATTTELERALASKRAGRLDEAVIALEGILTRYPTHAVVLAQLADTQLRRRKYSEAADALDRAESVAGTTAMTARIRGDLRYREQRWRDAARSYQEADALGERGTWALVQLARCHVRLGDLDGARGAAGRAIERDESAGGAWLALAEIARREDRLDDAVGYLERAHHHAPDDDYAYAKLIEARLLRLPPEARQREVEVLIRSGGEANRHLLAVLARVRSESGDEQQAAQAWRERRERHGGDLFARKQEAFALRRAGRLDEAAARMRACLLEDPADKVLFRTYIHLSHARDAVDELRATLEEMLPIAGYRKGAIYGELRKLGPTP